MTNKFLAVLMILFGISILQMQHISYANCTMLDSSGRLTVAQLNDGLASLLYAQTDCPSDVFAFRKLLIKSGLKLEPTMVANHGFHNSHDGNLSIFEIVSGRIKVLDNLHHIPDITRGDFFFGHFTTLSSDHHLVAAQVPENGSLMVEAFAWDYKRKLFNFYELIGNGRRGIWFYRGNSLDIYLDNLLLYREKDRQHPRFGKRLRCSGCHDAGGPIMKELYFPHNDWWNEKRHLNFGRALPDADLQEILADLVPPERLASSVAAGVKTLHENQTLDRQLTLQELLRPLFCPLEVNFKSDVHSNDEHSATIVIPSDFFIDSRLLADGSEQIREFVVQDDSIRNDIKISRADYQAALHAVGSHFPETQLKDADHAWLTPVKALSDKIAIQHLMNDGLIDEKLLRDILSIDMTNPQFSIRRCQLLRLVPQKQSPNWREVFIKNLSQSTDTAAQELLSNIKNKNKTIKYYQDKASQFLKQCQSKLRNRDRVIKLYLLLLQRRAEIRAFEISLNPKGQILEPNFRIIFPETQYQALPFKLQLTEECDVIN